MPGEPADQAPEILALALVTPVAIAREFYLGAVDKTCAVIDDDDAADDLLAAFVGVESPDALSSLDYLLAVHQLDDVLSWGRRLR